MATFLPVLALLAALGGGSGPDPEPPAVQVVVTERRPVIDGRLEPEVWARAARLGPLTEVDPDEGAPADPPTEILLLRDDEHLYLGVICHEAQPERLVLQNMERDAFLNEDDRIQFVFDTFRDGRTGYFFQISAAGSRGDALLGANGGTFNKRWDGFWEGRTWIGPDRWTAEIAIPFKTMAAGPGDTWGFNLERYRGADRTRYRWAAPRRDLRIMIVSEAGEIRGLGGTEDGLGLELVPYFKVRRSELEDPERKNLVGAGGGEFNWRITPQLTGSLTWNTDFAETEADQRRVNLTRFPLFFPEKRDFFLQDSNLFEFGEQSGFGHRGGGGNLLPFFSRRIGLSGAGEEIPIEAGARLAGRVEDLDLGLLAVRTGAAAGAPAGELFVARPSYRFTDELSGGLLLTSGNPETNDTNLVTGTDLRFSRTDFLPGYRLNLNAFVVRSSDEEHHEIGSAWGAQASLQSRDWTHRFDTLWSQSAFHPGLGFVRRPGERYYRLETRWEPRPENGGAIREYVFGFRPRWWTDSSGRVQSHGIDLTFFGLEWNSGDRFSATWAYDGDRLDQPFSPVKGTTIRKGFHHWNALETSFRFSDVRPLSGSLDLRAGQWYDGRAVRAGGGLDWRPDAHLRLGLDLREDHFFLPGGDFVSRVGILRGNYSFSPDLSWNNLLQADNQSDVVGLQSRLRWILADGQECFLVLNYAWQELAGGPFVPASRDLTAKVVWTLRF
ncbi:MAG: hypothetical protein D6702_12565 [Planctomycetota bacterium]|nr:MAG: hypothetical protein D6702_12565 [Planctomycetota bacterium]